MRRLTASVVGMVALAAVAGVAFEACVKKVPRSVLEQSARFDYGIPVYEKEDDTELAAGQGALGGPGDPSADATSANPAASTEPLRFPLNSISTADFVDHLKKLTFDRSVENGQFALSYPCELPPSGGSTKPQPCNNSVKNLSAFIEPEIGMIHVSHTDIDGLTNGIIVARIIVYGRGTGRLPHFNVPIGHHAWWFIGKDENGVLRSRIIERAPGGGPNLRLDTLATLPFVACDTVKDHVDVPAGSPTSARWWNCHTYHQLLRARGARGAKPPVSYFASAARGPFGDALALKPLDDVALDAAGWIRCGNGCCATAQ